MARMNQEAPRKPRRTASEIQDILHRYRQSQASKTVFAAQEGICLATLRRYMRRNETLSAEASGRFLEVHQVGAAVIPDRRDSYRVCFREGFALEIPAGFSLREVASLLEVVSAMGER